MPHNLFFNTDLPATPLQATAGQLVAILDQVLVNGGPSIAITSATRVGTTVTVTTTAAHNLNPTLSATFDRRLTHSGFTQPEYNIEAVCTVTGPSTYTFQCSGSPATPATGTGVSKLTPLGWTIAYTATNKRSYQQGVGSNAFFLDIDDSLGVYATFRGYETMTAVGVGSNPFPTPTQQPISTLLKSSAATTRAWIFAGNSKRAWFFTDSTGVVMSAGHGLVDFGDTITEVSGDIYGTTIASSTSTSPPSGVQSAAPYLSTTATTTSRYVPRLATGIGTSIVTGMHSDSAKNTSTGLGGGSCAYPAQNGGAYLSPLTLHHNNSPRGTIPGVYDICHNKPFTHFDTFTGAGQFAGKKFLVVNTVQYNGNPGQCVVETTPW